MIFFKNCRDRRLNKSLIFHVDIAENQFKTKMYSLDKILTECQDRSEGF